MVSNSHSCEGHLGFHLFVETLIDLGRERQEETDSFLANGTSAIRTFIGEGIETVVHVEYADFTVSNFDDLLMPGREF